MSKYAEKKLKNIVDWLASTPVATTSPHPDCAHCDNGRKWASTHPVGDSQCKTGPNGKCKCGRWLSQV